MPTNIIWQERNKTSWETRLKRLLSFFLILILLVVTMTFVFLIRQYGSYGVSSF